MRTFIAVEIPDDVKLAVEEYSKSIRGLFERGTIKWVRGEYLHFTVKFLGEVPQTKIDAVKEAVAQAAGDFSQFSLSVSHPGFFPNEQRPRVIWLGADGGADNLLEVFQDLETRLEEAGFDRESKPFSPHLTIGRVRRNLKIQVHDLLPHFEPCRFQVEGLTVMHSTLTPKGPVYDRIEVCRFGG